MTEHLGHGKNELIVSDIKVAYRLGCLASSSVGAIHSAYCCTTCPSSDMRSLKAPHDGHKTESSIPGVTTLGVIPPRRPLRGLESPTLAAVPAAPESLPRAGTHSSSPMECPLALSHIIATGWQIRKTRRHASFW